MSRQRPSAAASSSQHVFDHPVEAVLFAGAVIAVVGVALYFDMSVNRVFDVPKAFFLKTVGGGTALIWLINALFFKGIRWRSAQVFAVPVACLAACVSISTLLSLDLPMSLYGVYERQFGLQGFIACVGLYFVVATTVSNRRGVVMGLAILAGLGALLGAYAVLQSQGHDPWPFFRKPHNKVYSYLGNATFAGNALALIFPMTAILAVVGAAESNRRSPNKLKWGLVLGASTVMGLTLITVPAYLAAADLGQAPGHTAQIISRVCSVQFIAILGVSLGMGSFGPTGLRLTEPKHQRLADAVASGWLIACVVLIAAGLFFTRTRGAWVATGVAVSAGLILLPMLFADNPPLRARVSILTYSALGISCVLIGIFVMTSEHIAARTIRSIPAAFDPSRTDFGKGQGTRPYLWSESIRVLTEHQDTLTRRYEDEAERAQQVKGAILRGTPFRENPPASSGAQEFERSWRGVSVWLFGIGIETYRYAFMSHKSKRLEELDPMTNHDNPHNNYLYVLASFGVVGLAAYLWLLWSLLRRSFMRFLDTSNQRWERALAFGVVSSFFSYAVYSIAGFDSVACSVFFYFLLGLSAVLFEPSESQRVAPLGAWIAAQWGSSSKDTELEPPKSSDGVMAINLAIFVLVGGLLLHTTYSGHRTYRAEEAFTGRASGGPRTLERRVRDIYSAIEIAPHESYYKQNLGTIYSQGAAQVIRRAQGLKKMMTQPGAQNAEKREEIQRNIRRMEVRARQYLLKARLALFAALDHAWAPENIYISLFQVAYSSGDLAEAERALELALRHSPHLGAVRANLAALKEGRGAWDEALVDCRWVLEVDKKSGLAHRVCGHALLEKGQLEQARVALKKAEKYSRGDRSVAQLLKKLEAISEEKTSTVGGK